MKMTIVMQIIEILLCPVEEYPIMLLLSHKNLKLERKMRIRIINNKKRLSILRKLRLMMKERKKSNMKMRRKRRDSRKNMKKEAIRNCKSLILQYLESHKLRKVCIAIVRTRGKASGK